MRNLRFILIGVIVMASFAGSLLAADHPQQSTEHPGQMSEADMMKAYTAAATPGAEHAMLAKSAGKWKVAMQTWIDPSASPMTSEGTEVSEMVLGGRFVQSSFNGSGPVGPFTGLRLFGYDNVKKKYCGTWSDTMGTGIMYYEGDYNPQTKEIVCHGDFVDAATGMTTTAKLVSRTISDDEHEFEFWSPGPDGKDVKRMQMHYTREK